MGITLLCPTRNRPDNVRRLIATATGNAAGPIGFTFYVDDDDPTRGQIHKLQATHPAMNYRVDVIEGPRVVLSQMWNRCAEHPAAADVMMHCGDDLVFRTPGWDRLILETFEQYPDKILLAYGRDGIHDKNLATHGFLHRRWVDTVGYFCPPLFKSDYNDTWLDEVAREIDRRVYIPEVFYEHMHPAVGKAPMDLTHRERLNRHIEQRPGQIYAETRDQRLQDAAKLREAIQRYQEGADGDSAS